MMIARVAFLMMTLLFGCCLSTRSGVTITIGTGEKVMIQVELADTPEERARGLMFRHYLPEGEGMLFLFPAETQASFWMKDTPISLDLLFIKEDRIVDIIENAVPNSEMLLTPDSTYTMVLEVPGGYLARKGIQVGDLIEVP